MSRILPESFDFDGPFPSQSRRLRLGIVGGGRIAVTQAMAARLTDRWEIVAAALSSDPKKAKSRSADWYLPESRSYASFAEMAELESARADGVDAVMITTPNHVHFDASRTFLDAGIDVLCDKPLTNELGEARDLVIRAKVEKRVFAVGYVMSCFPMVRQARELVCSGRIGRVNQIHVEFLQDWMVPEDSANAEHVKWRLDPARSGATSCVGDIATHAAHIASFITGLALTELRADFHVCGTPKPLEDTVFMMTKYQGDVPGTLIATRLASGNRGGLRVRIFGSAGGVEWDLEHAEFLKLSRYGEPDQTLSRGQGHGIGENIARLVRTGRGFPEGIIEAWSNLYTEFALAVAATRDGLEIPPGWLNYPSVEEGAGGVAFIEAAVRSNESQGAWISCA